MVGQGADLIDGPVDGDVRIAPQQAGKRQQELAQNQIRHAVAGGLQQLTVVLDHQVRAAFVQVQLQAQQAFEAVLLVAAQQIDHVGQGVEVVVAGQRLAGLPPRLVALGEQLERLPEAQLVDGGLNAHFRLGDAFQAQVVGDLFRKPTALGADAPVQVAEDDEELVQVVAEVAAFLNQLLLLVFQQFEHAAQQRQQ